MLDWNYYLPEGLIRDGQIGQHMEICSEPKGAITRQRSGINRPGRTQSQGP
jgi:hypothetical protein